MKVYQVAIKRRIIKDCTGCENGAAWLYLTELYSSLELAEKSIRRFFESYAEAVSDAYTGQGVSLTRYVTFKYESEVKTYVLSIVEMEVIEKLE